MKESSITIKDVILETRGNVAIIHLNRPEKLNAMGLGIMDGVSGAIDVCNTDPDIRAVVITGEGRAFCAGGDIDGAAKMETIPAFRNCMGCGAFMRKIESCQKPVIAAINGFCLGGGLEIALCCDIRFAAENARLGLAEVNMGIMPGGGGTQRLPRLVGPSKAKMLMFSGEAVKPDAALAMGLVDMVYPKETMLEEAIKYAEKIALMPPVAVAQLKLAVNNGMQMTLEQGQMYEATLYGYLFSTEDSQEAMAAFLEKREHKPFQGK